MPAMRTQRKIHMTWWLDLVQNLTAGIVQGFGNAIGLFLAGAWIVDHVPSVKKRLGALFMKKPEKTEDINNSRHK